MNKNIIVITITFAVAVVFNFLFSLVYLIHDCGNVHFKNLLEEMSIVVVVPRKTDSINLKIIEERVYTNKITQDMKFVSSDQAWEKLKNDNFINADYKKYASNNLPHTFMIKLEYAPTVEIMSFVNQLKTFPGVQEVIFDKMTVKWLKVFEGYLDYSYLIFLALSSIMVFSVILLSALYLLIKNYTRYLALLFMQGFAGLCGGCMGFMISFFSLKNIYVEPVIMSGMQFRYLVFAGLSSIVIGLFIALFTTVMSKEVKVVAY